MTTSSTPRTLSLMTLVFATALGACGGEATQSQSDDSTSRSGGVDASFLALAKSKNCLACHSVDNKVVGPAFRDIAARYASDVNAQDALTEKVMRGGRGIWGAVPMPPNEQVTADQASSLVASILELPPAPPRSVVVEPSASADPAAYAKSHNCMACHSSYDNIVGPAFYDIAMRYAGDDTAKERLAAEVVNGSKKGIWSVIPMPPNERVTLSNARSLVQWILDTPAPDGPSWR